MKEGRPRGYDDPLTQMGHAFDALVSGMLLSLGGVPGGAARSGGVPRREGAMRDSLALVRAARLRTLALLEGLGQEQLDAVPAPGRWSIGEVLDHLLLFDGLCLREIGELVRLKRSGERPFLWRTFSEVNASPRFVPQSLLPLAEFPAALLNLFLPAEVRELAFRFRWLPAESPDVARPRKGRSADELRRCLMASLEAMEDLVTSQPGIDFRELTYYHPALGASDVPQLLRYLARHEGRHQDQIREMRHA